MFKNVTFAKFLVPLALTANILAIASSASAQTSAPSITAIVTPPADDPIAYYRDYEAAVVRGDIQAAAQSAVLAWQTGERVWNGTNPNLPGLAFNAAWSLGLANKITEAQAPARRAVALAIQTPGRVELKEATFLLAYADMMIAPNRARIDAFSEAAGALDNGGWGDYLLTRAYLDGARTALNTQMPRVSRLLIDRGLLESARVMPTNDGMRTNFLILRTQASLQMREFGKAVTEVMEARRSYGVPKSTRDLNWSSLAAWEAASRAVYKSVMGPRYGTGSRLARADAIPEWNEAEQMALSDMPVECHALDFQRRGRGGPQGISFPSSELRDGYAGGAYVRVKLDEQGKVIETDVRAALPRPGFGTAAERGIRSWQYDMPAGTPAQCRMVDIFIMYAFGG